MNLFKTDLYVIYEQKFYIITAAYKEENWQDRKRRMMEEERQRQCFLTWGNLPFMGNAKSKSSFFFVIQSLFLIF